MSFNERSEWVALNLLPGLGTILTYEAVKRFGDPGLIAYRLSPAGWRSLPRMREKALARVLQSRSDVRSRAEAELRRVERIGARVITWSDADYPAALRTLDDPPMVLYVKGRLDGPGPRIAVVGSRAATHYGRTVARGLGAGLAARGFEVVSGGARGVDTATHEGALQVGGRTVAVIGSGLLQPYPRENATLFSRIAEQGALVSELPLETPPAPRNFPQRNRLISGLCAGVVVVEAAERSGSLSTAGHAVEQGREVMAVPGLVSTEQAQGCHRLIQQGAKLVQRVEDILEELSPMYTGALVTPRGLTEGEKDTKKERLEPDESAVLAVLREAGQPVQVDGLAEIVPFGVARLQTALFGLELKGSVEQLPGRYYLPRPVEPPRGA